MATVRGSDETPIALLHTDVSQLSAFDATQDSKTLSCSTILDDNRPLVAWLDDCRDDDARDGAMKDNASTQGRLTDLLAYQDRVKSTPEWPFDSSTLMRFGLYLLIPVGSMIGGALVERVVIAMLD